MLIANTVKLEKAISVPAIDLQKSIVSISKVIGTLKYLRIDGKTPSLE